ncbi:hypothetical protein V1477_018661 [Vespula maculifrons]|uniref:Uncharacterized protein n=1 Tax=Vespula maculifrons TaxID=7453 RepID=A0ABD2AWF0_VESMC
MYINTLERTDREVGRIEKEVNVLWSTLVLLDDNGLGSLTIMSHCSRVPCRSQGDTPTIAFRSATGQGALAIVIKSFSFLPCVVLASNSMHRRQRAILVSI